MALNWRQITLGDCAKWLSGGTPSKKSSEYWSGSIPWVSAKDMKSLRLYDAADHISESAIGSGGKVVPRGTILLLVRGMTLHNDVPICIASRQMAFNQDIKALRPVQGVDGDFLAYWLLAHKRDLLASVDHAGHGTGRLVTETLKNKKLSLPPLAEQRKIAELLVRLDDKIELNHRMNTTLEAMAHGLFRSWFVDFDPVRAKLDGDNPWGLDAATATLFPSRFEHGGCGVAPPGWMEVSIDSVCDINAWALGKGDELSVIEYVEISEVERGEISHLAHYVRGEEPSRARRRLRHGDTALSTVRPDRGSYFLALNPPGNRIASTGFAVLSPKSVPWSLLHIAVTQPEVFDYFGRMADGGAYPAIRPEVIGTWRITLPDSLELLKAFHRVCAPLLQQAAANRAQSRTLADIRDTLLPKLISGELRLKT